MAIPNISEIIDGKRVITKKPELLLPAGNRTIGRTRLSRNLLLLLDETKRTAIP